MRGANGAEGRELRDSVRAMSELFPAARGGHGRPQLTGAPAFGCHDWPVSSWFRTYGYASVYERLIVGALPLDEADVRMLAALGVSRVLNLVEDAEYGRGARQKVERALADVGIRSIG